MNLPIETGSPLELPNTNGAAIEVVGVCRDVEIYIGERKSLQTFFVTFTSANHLLLMLLQFLSMREYMTDVGC